MPQEESQEVKELRRQMRKGRAPLLETIRATHPLYLLVRKSLERNNSAVREQLGLLNNTLAGSIKKLRESARNTDDSGEGVLLLYQEMSRQAKAVAAFIDKELPGSKSCLSRSVRLTLPMWKRWMRIPNICSSGLASSLRVIYLVGRLNLSNKASSRASDNHNPHRILTYSVGAFSPVPVESN